MNQQCRISSLKEKKENHIVGSSISVPFYRTEQNREGVNQMNQDRRATSQKNSATLSDLAKLVPYL
jgi:hypothetical protein